MRNQEPIVSDPLPGENSATLETLAAQHGFSLEAARTLWQSLRAGGGTMAQFSHPELGGTGQWTQGGLIMIGDMFNHALKARVDRLCSELATLLPQSPTQSKSHSSENASDNWWGADLGASAASGSQNDIRYAYFPATQRLAVLQENRVTIYDTGSYHITGISQGQSATGSLSFTSQRGSVRLTDLSVVSGRSPDTPSLNKRESSREQVDGGQTAPPRSQQKPSEPDSRQERSAEIFYQIERLAELRDKGILSEAEFVLKKTELLTRL